RESIAMFIGEFRGRPRSLFIRLTLSRFFAKSANVIVAVAAAATLLAVLCITLRFGTGKFRQVRISRLLRCLL
ncbi:MAG: hypothetical protein M3H12_15725, partial [Chromatiales bacterium]